MFYLLAIVFIIVSNTYAQTPEIINGLNYLNSTQNTDGSWGDDTTGAQTVPSTISVVDTMNALDETGSQNYADAVSWLQGQALDTTGYISERMHVLSEAGTDQDVLISYIDNIYTEAWGGYEDYDVNTLDTILALQALQTVSYSDLETIGYALSYLIDNQNPDGGFGLYFEDDSSTYVTSLVLKIFAFLNGTFDLQEEIDDAAAYLLTKQNADGGFGSSPSTVYETALAFISLIESGQGQAQPMQDALNYIQTSQQPDGSWNDDPYSTALALRALQISASQEPAPTTGTVTGRTVDASTGQPLNGVSVDIEDSPEINAVTDLTGNFTLVDIPEGSRTIRFSMPGYMTGTTPQDIAAGSIHDLGVIQLSAIPATGIIKGVVNDADTGLSLEGVTVSVTGSFNGSTMTGSDGSFTITDVTPGSVTLTAEKTGYYTVAGTGTVTAGGILLFNPQLSTQPPSTTTGNLVGIVFDASTNTPVQNASIALTSGPSTVTDGQGGFSISDITAGEYQVTVSAAGYISQYYQALMVSGVTTDMQIVYLTPSFQSTTISGSVFDVQTGDAIVNADVVINGTGISTTTDASGTYTLSNISSLEFDIKAIATGYESYTYHMSSTGFGSFEADFNLSQVQLSDLKVVAITALPAVPTQGDQVTLEATIFNAGYSSASNALVRIFEGDPDRNGVQIGADLTISSITPGSPETVSVSYDTTDKPGRREIFVQIDPLNSVQELDETNNSASGTLTVLVPPDLLVQSTEIKYAPVNPTVDTGLVVNAVVRNVGEKEVNNVLVNLYDGDPSNGGLLISNYTIPALSGDGSNTAVFTANNLTTGSNTLYVIADPVNAISEIDESNNTGSVSVNILQSVSADLSIYPSDISLSIPPGAVVGDVFSIYISVGNSGSSDVQTELAFYNGNPGNGGVLMSKLGITVPALGTLNSIEHLNYPGDGSVIYVSVDPDDLVAETIETNNMAFAEIAGGNLPDFVVTEHHIRYNPSNPTPNSQITIEADIFNYGGGAGYAQTYLYEGDPDNGGVQKGLFIYPITGGNYIEPHNVKTPYIKISNLSLGEHEFFVVVDHNNSTNEVNENNNKAKVIINVVSDPGHDLSVAKKDITFSPEAPLEGELVSVIANIYNAGAESVGCRIAYYIGDPSSGGTLIRKLWSTINQEGITQVSSSNFYMPAGVPEIFVVIDEDNDVVELDENNNIASRTIDTYKDDLWVTTGDISLNPLIPDEGDEISVDVVVHSSGQTSRTATLNVYEGDPADGNLIGSVDFTAAGSQSVTLSVPSYIYPGRAVLTAVIDNITPSDVDQSNNTAVATYGEWIEDGMTSEGTDFWLAWTYTRASSVSLIIQSRYSTNYTVTLPGANGLYRGVTGTVSPGAPAKVILSDRNNVQLKFYNDTIEDKGIHITSDKEVSVLFHHPVYSSVADETFLVMPTDLIGTDYYIMTYEPVLATEPAEYTIVAVEDNTHIDIEGNMVNLDRGQTYFYYSATDLTGTRLRSDKKVALIASTVTSDIPKSVPRVCCADPVFEQMLPVSQFGTDYIVAPLYSPDSGEIYRILAVEDGTDVLIKFRGYTNTVSLNQGEWTEFVYEHDMHITSNSPITVMQYMQGLFVAGIGDPSQITIIPTDMMKMDYRFYTHEGYEQGDYVTIVAPEPDTTIYLDGVLLNEPRMPLFEKGDYIIVSSLNVGEHEVLSDKPVAVNVYGYRQFGSYGYTAGFALPIANLKMNMSADPPVPAEGQLVDITADLVNEGNKWAKNFVVRAFNGNPMNGGVQIGTDISIDTIYPKETKTFNIAWESFGQAGVNNIYIVADSDDDVKETNEADNTAMASVYVTTASKPDPSITNPGITLSHQIAAEGDVATLFALIKNRGAAIDNIPVSLYLGDPGSGGSLLESKVIPQIVPLNGEVTVDFSFSTLGFSDNNDLFVVVDPDNGIDELIENNNTAVAGLQVDRQKMALQVVTDAAQYTANTDVEINVFIRNESNLKWSGTGEVRINDTSGTQVVQLATFNLNDLNPLGLEGWHYRVPITVSESTDLDNAIAAVYVNFNDFFSSLGLTGKTLDLNSIRMLEFDGADNFIAEKNVQFKKDSDFNIVTKPSGSICWLMDGTTSANNPRYFYLYFDSEENGVKPVPVNTDLPLKEELVAFSGRWADVYTVTVNDDGTFGTPAPAFQVSLTLLLGFGFDDFTNDGYPDIITADAWGDIHFHENAADNSNTFLPKVTIGNMESSSTGNNILQAVVSADYNGDGYKDFMINVANSELHVFYGSENGSFSKEIVSHYQGRLVTGKASIDLNNDGYDDIVTGDDRGAISVLFNKNGQGFEAPASFEKIYNGRIHSLDAGDLDGDGYADILFSLATRDTYIMKGKADGLFEPAVQVQSFVDGNMASYEIYDVNGDGINDVMAVQYSPSDIYYFEGYGDGTFKAPVNIPTDTTYASAVEVSRTMAAPDVVATIGTPEEIGSELFQFIWNTGNTLAGDHFVSVELYDMNTNRISDKSVAIELLPTGAIDGNLVTDKITYYPNETVTIMSTVLNNNVNTIYEDIAATVTVKDFTAQTLFTENRAIGLLTPSSNFSFDAYWNTGTNPSGDYPVTLEVKDASGNVLSVSTNSITISSGTSPSVLLTGQISVDNQSLLQGDPANITYRVTNTGNIDLSQVDLSVVTVHAVEQTVYDTLTDQTALLMDATYSNTWQLDTQSYSAKDYLVILRADISGVEETLASTYFRIEGAPSAPSLNLPAEGQDVEILTPDLSVNNASDPNDDQLSYEFEIYEDPAMTMLAASETGIGETEDTTSWTVTPELVENSRYYWRARAYDGFLYGDWMDTASFRVNVINDPPTAPTLSSPADNSEVDTFTPVLTVNNAFDSDSENLTYNFEIALDAGFTQTVTNEIGVFEGVGTTGWQVPVNLSENTHYYWRAQADDWLEEGPWMAPAGFFVNTANEAPSVPAIISPADSSEVTGLAVDIVITNSTDPESDPLTYAFELDTVNTFDSPDFLTASGIAEGAGTTAWNTTGLMDNTWYYVRAKASDGQAESPWSAVTAFFVNTVNDPPTMPILANPSDGGSVNVFMPELSVHNASDIDGDTLTYKFELYADAAMTTLVSAAAAVQETANITSWTVPVSLMENNTYYWRARAYDGELNSGWTALASFMVNTANDAPTAPVLESPAEGSSVDTLTPTLIIQNATDPENDILTYRFEIYEGSNLVQGIEGILEGQTGTTSLSLSGALSNDTTYTWRASAHDGDRYGAWMDMATFTVHLPVLSINGTIDFDPNTLNKKSKGKWVVVYIELPDGYNVNDIDVTTVFLEGSIPAEPWPYAVGDEDNDGIADLMVKFRRSDVINILPTGDNITIHVSGSVGSVDFEGIDIIRVINE